MNVKIDLWVEIYTAFLTAPGVIWAGNFGGFLVRFFGWFSDNLPVFLLFLLMLVTISCGVEYFYHRLLPELQILFTEATLLVNFTMFGIPMLHKCTRTLEGLETDHAWDIFSWGPVAHSNRTYTWYCELPLCGCCRLQRLWKDLGKCGISSIGTKRWFPLALG